MKKINKKKLSQTIILCGISVNLGYSMDFNNKREVFQSNPSSYRSHSPYIYRSHSPYTRTHKPSQCQEEVRSRKSIHTNQQESQIPSIPMPHAPAISLDTPQGINFDLLTQSILDVEKFVQNQIKRERNNPTRVLILGTTGSGKSTLIHSLAGKRLISRYTESRDGFKLDIEDTALSGVEIGHGLNSSTSRPVPWYDQRANCIYWDCPGFLDTRGAGQEIINSFAIDQVFSTPSRIKILLAIQEADFEYARGMGAIHQFIKLTSLMPDINQLKQSLNIIITKKKNSEFRSSHLIDGLLQKVREALEIRQVESKPVEDLEKVLEVLSYIQGNEERIATFYLSVREGHYTFEDKEKLIHSLRSSPVLNPSHVLSVDQKTLWNILQMCKQFCDVPSLCQEWKHLVQNEYRDKDLTTLMQWRRMISFIEEQQNEMTTPFSFATIFERSLPSHMKSNQTLHSIKQKFETAQRYFEFANRVSLGSNGNMLQGFQIKTLLFPLIDDIKVELKSMIDYRELIERQQAETKRIKEQLDQAVQDRTLEAREAIRQYQNLENRLKRERNDAESQSRELQEQLQRTRRETDERVQRQIRETKQKHDEEIRALERRLSQSDQSALIRTLRARIEELEGQLRGINRGRQVAFVPGIGFIQL